MTLFRVTLHLWYMPCSISFFRAVMNEFHWRLIYAFSFVISVYFRAADAHDNYFCFQIIAFDAKAFVAFSLCIHIYLCMRLFAYRVRRAVCGMQHAAFARCARQSCVLYRNCRDHRPIPIEFSRSRKCKTLVRFVVISICCCWPLFKFLAI